MNTDDLRRCTLLRARGKQRVMRAGDNSAGGPNGALKNCALMGASDSPVTRVATTSAGVCGFYAG